MFLPCFLSCCVTISCIFYCTFYYILWNILFVHLQMYIFVWLFSGLFGCFCLFVRMFFVFFCFVLFFVFFLFVSLFCRYDKIIKRFRFASKVKWNEIVHTTGLQHYKINTKNIAKTWAPLHILYYIDRCELWRFFREINSDISHVKYQFFPARTTFRQL